jgi:adenylate cyclase
LPSGFVDAQSKEIIDIYIPTSDEHPVLRIRKNGDRYEITKKQPIEGNDSSRQLETTISLIEAEYAELSLLQGKRIQKTRFNYEEEGINYEIDIFNGDLSGLILVDVEFDTIEKRDTFVAPSWCLKEVTQEVFTAGGALSGKKYSDIEEKLTNLGYRKIEV